MKIIKVLFGLLVILVLISSYPALAQEDDPARWLGPDLDMFDPPDAQTDTPPTDALTPPPDGDFDVVRDAEGNITYIPIPAGLDRANEPLPDAVPLVPEIPDPALIVPPAEKDYSPSEEVTDEADRVVQPLGDLISIGTHPTFEEYNPTVAHGGDYYMVAFVRDGSIFASVYYNNGNHLTTYLVDDWITDHNVPRIAYHAPTNLFLIAYHTNNGLNFDIWYRAVSAISGPVGVVTGINASVDEKFPDVACNQTANSCLVAYEHGGGDSIRGRYLTLSSLLGISSSSSTYILANTNGLTPYLTWGNNTGRYLLVYTYTDVGLVQSPVFTHIYDTNLGGTPYTHGAMFAWNFAAFPKNKWATGTAYDPCTEKFIILYDYDFAGLGTDTDVYFSAVHATAGVSHSNYNLSLATADERGGDIAFITDDHLTPACGVMDKLGVTYTDWTNKRIYTTDLRGNSSVSNTNYTKDIKSVHHIVATLPSNAVPFWKSSISSGPAQAHMFVAYNELITSPFNPNVRGLLVRTPAWYFLPLLVK